MSEIRLITVVIVNWNSGHQLKTCLNSIIKFGRDMVDKVIVVDNCSIDGSECIADALSDVILITADENLGFAKACNLGAQYTNSEYLLFLNPDAELYPETLKKALDFMQLPENTQIGICGVQLIDEKGHVARSCARYPTVWRFLSHIVGFNRIVPSSGYFMEEWEHDETREVDHVIGAFFLVRHKVFEQIDGFDERFFVYLEDLDFSFRAYQAGWKSIYLVDAQAFHAGGGTSNQVKTKRLFYSLRSRLLYGFKHFPTWQAWFLMLLTCLIEPITRTVFCILKRDWAGVANTLSGYKMLASALPGIVRRKGVSNP